MKPAQRFCLALTVTLAATSLPSTIGLSQGGNRRTQPTIWQPQTSTKTVSGAPASSARKEWEQKQDWTAFASNVLGDTTIKDSLKQLLDSGSDINATDKTGRTVMHVAAMRGQTELARYLLSRGAKVDVRDRLGRTPLMVSASLGGFRISSDLSSPWPGFWTYPLCLDKEADDPAGRARKELLDWYAVAPIYPPLVRLLIEAGADVNAADGEGQTVLDYAGMGGPTEIDRLIWASGRVRGGQKCELKVAQSPALRGFRLGMTLAEVSARFPRYEISEADSCGRLNVYMDATFGRLGAEARRPEEFDGVQGIQLGFLDGRLNYLRVTYDGGTFWKGVGEYLVALSGSLGLPASWYKGEDRTTLSQAHTLGCDGFKVVAGFNAGPYVELHDTAAIQTMLRRKTEDVAKREREAEEERERRRKAFKP